MTSTVKTGNMPKHSKKPRAPVAREEHSREPAQEEGAREVSGKASAEAVVSMAANLKKAANSLISSSPSSAGPEDRGEAAAPGSEARTCMQSSPSAWKMPTPH